MLRITAIVPDEREEQYLVTVRDVKRRTDKEVTISKAELEAAEAARKDLITVVMNKYKQDHILPQSLEARTIAMIGRAFDVK